MPAALGTLALAGDARKGVLIDLDLKPAHDVLVRSPGTEPGAADVCHLLSGNTAIIPGTSLAGVMRAHALRIARLVRDGHKDAEQWVDRLFGPRFEGQRPRRGFQPHASRLRVSESNLVGSQPHTQTRVAIDRFTQGVVETALFEEQTQVGGTTKVQLELRDSHDGELGLVLLVIKDLLDGMVPVGGTSSVGRGIVRGSATVTWQDGSGAAPQSARIEPGRSPEGEAAQEIDVAITSFHKAKPLTDATQVDNERGE
ncbi:MAG TPA: RAMP superfamily CRISPR-associated protein, partial [Candidatus Obscuribacterales bacterium]